MSELWPLCASDFEETAITWYKNVTCWQSITKATLGLISVWAWLLENSGQHLFGHQTTASSNWADVFVRSSVDDIKTSRAEMNVLGLFNWIAEPGDENQKSRGDGWEKRRESGLNWLNNGEKEGEVLQLSGRYGSHEAAQPYRKRRAQGKGKDKQGQWHEVGEVKRVGGWRELEGEERMEFRVFVSGGVWWDSSFPASAIVSLFTSLLLVFSLWSISDGGPWKDIWLVSHMAESNPCFHSVSCSQDLWAQFCKWPSLCKQGKAASRAHIKC